MKQFNTDSKIKKTIINSQYKKHPKWEQRKFIRLALLLIPIVIAVVSYSTLDLSNGLVGDDGFDKIMRIMISICLGILGIIPWIIYVKTLKATCLCVVDFRENDTLIVAEDEVKYVYHPKDQYDYKIYQQLDIKFSDIRKIIYNSYHERVDIYGRIKETWYSDYSKGKVGRVKNHNKVDTRIRIYLYFDNNEELLEELKVKSPVKIEEINYSEE